MKNFTPAEIEAESMRIIDREAGEHTFSEDEWRIVRRIIHATADFEIMKTIRFHQNAVAAGLEAIRGGGPIYADTEMLAAAINKKVKERWGGEVYCLIADEDVREQSEATGETRSAIAVRKAASMLAGGIIAVGNAPTALHEAVSLCEKGVLSPALIIGLPVGFVEARESKERLYRTGFTWITNIDRKGGTPAAAAVINALIKIAESEM